MVLLTLLLTAVPVVMFFLLRSQYADPCRRVEDRRSVFAWVPPAWPGVAMAAAGQGQAGTALAAMALLAGRRRSWRVALDRDHFPSHARAGQELHHPGQRQPVIRFRTIRPVGSPGIGAGPSRRWNCDLLWREPARLPGVIISTVVFGGVFTIIAAALFDLGTAGMAVFGVCAVSFIAVGHRLNEIRIHSSALWMNVVARGLGVE